MNKIQWKRYQKERNKAIKYLSVLYTGLPATLPLVLSSERKILVHSSDFIDYLSNVTKIKKETVANHMSDLNNLNSLNRLDTVDNIEPYEKRYSDYVTSLNLPEECLDQVINAFWMLAPELKLIVPSKIPTCQKYLEEKVLE